MIRFLVRVATLVSFCGAGVFGLLACGGEDSDVLSAEIWMFQRSDWGATTTTTRIEENYHNAREIDPGTVTSDWDRSTTYNYSDELFFGQIRSLLSGGKVLVTKDRAYPGQQVGGNWEFTWEGNDTTNDAENFRNGQYVFLDDTEIRLTSTFSIPLSAITTNGTVTWTKVSTRAWQETDDWSPATVGVGAGQTPANTYLETPIGGAVTNAPNADDCEGTLCSLSVITTETRQAAIEGFLTDYTDDDAFDFLDSTGQPEGTGLP